MKHILSICLLLVLTTSAQSQKSTFVRIFDETGRKIHKGFLQSMTDSSLTILKNNQSFEIPVSQIDVIKLKRSFGHKLLVSALIAGASFAVIGAAAASPDNWLIAYTAGQGALSGLIFGSAIGLIGGSIAGIAADKPFFTINKNAENWIKVKAALQIYLPEQNKK